jgi:FkbM family methyltransferase
MKSLLMKLLAARPVMGPVPYATLGDGERGLSYRIRKKAWDNVRKPFELAWFHGLRLNVASDDETFWAVFSTGAFEPNEFRFLEDTLRPGMTVLDIGANIGLYSLFASRKVGPTGNELAIEASSREFAKLEDNISLNRARNISSFSFAVSNRRSTTQIRVATEDHAGNNSLGGFAYEQIKLAHIENVETFTLDEITARHCPARIDFIKMDIEGAELFALSGARKTIERSHPLMLIEVSDRSLSRQNCTSGQLLDLLESFGYTLSTFDPKTGSIVPAERGACVDSINVIARWHHP